MLACYLQLQELQLFARDLHLKIGVFEAHPDYSGLSVTGRENVKQSKTISNHLKKKISALLVKTMILHAVNRSGKDEFLALRKCKSSTWGLYCSEI